MILAPTIQMSNGGYFHLDDPRASDPFTVKEIAHALSNICRFVGHCREFYSVAQHSVLVSKLVPREFAMHGLFHDAAEAFIGDFPSPLKHYLGDTLLSNIEEAAEEEIHRRLYSEYKRNFPAVKDADLRALSTEKRDLMPPNSPWSVEATHPADERPVIAVPAEFARILFMERYIELQKNEQDDGR